MKGRLKAVIPTLKERKRYLLFEILPEDQKMDFSAVSREIKESMFTFIGTRGMSEASMMLLQDKFKDNKGVIRVNHNYIAHTKSALALITHMGESKVICKTVSVSGTLNKIKKTFRI